MLPPGERIEELDLPSFRKAVRHIQRAGIARTIQLNLAKDLASSAPELVRTLKHVNPPLE